MLTIELDPRLRAEPGDGSYIFPDSGRTIRFGRSMDSDIRFPASERSLGRAHFELRPAAGSYEIVTDREHPVFLESKRIIGTMALLSTTEIRLVDPEEGPRIRITTTNDRPEVATQKSVWGTGNTIQDLMWTFRGTVQFVEDLIWTLRGTTRLIGWGLVAFALATLIGGGWFLNELWQQRQFLASAVANTNNLIATLGKKMEESAPPDWKVIGAKVSKSVYQIAITKNDVPTPVEKATAWVYGPHTLVTNAHAAALYDKLSRKESLVVIAPDGARRVVKVIARPKLHPAREIFYKVVAEMQKGGIGIDQMGSYDLALLEVDPSAQLESPLVPSRTVAMGQEIGFFGYIAETAQNKSLGQLRIGHISGSTDFLGIAHDINSELIYHTAVGGWGASGSPIFDKEGKVVAIFSGGEALRIGETKTVTGTNTFYAQSVVLLDDFNSEVWSPEKLAESIAGWTSKVLYLSRKDKVWMMLREFGNRARLDRKDFAPVFEDEGFLDNEGSVPLMTTELEPGTYVAFAFPYNTETPERGAGAQLRMRVMVGDTAIQSPLYLDAAATTIFKFAKEGKATFVLGGAPQGPYWLQLHRLDKYNM